jgi:hypothetical protein
MNLNWIKDTNYKSDLHFIKDITQIQDSVYLKFMNEFGDGYYFNQSLHIYGNSESMIYHDYIYRTNLIKTSYHWINEIDKIKCFGEDLFGNQYIFYSLGVGMLTIENGNIEFISNDFNEWLLKIEEDLDYYTGESLKIIWSSSNEKLEYYERLTPKKPFVLGGKYEIENLYSLDFSSIIGFNSYIAKQIYDMPDGSKISLKLE